MAGLHIITLRGSVGWKARNDANDVRAIQLRLNVLMMPPRAPLVVDGRSGPKTEKMILDFQQNAMGIARPDARVDAGGATLKALNDVASMVKWSGAAKKPGATPAPGTPGAGGGQYPAGASNNEKLVIDAMRQSAAGAGSPVALAVIDMIVQDQWFPHFKNIMNGIGSVQWAAEFGYAIKSMGAIDSDAQMIFNVFKDYANSRLCKLKFLQQLLKDAKDLPAFATAIKRLGRIGKVLNVLGVAVCAMEVINHARNGRYGPALAEVYGTAMGMSQPWAAVIDGIQGLAFDYAPSLRANPIMVNLFRYLNAVNPIGAGKTGIDSLVTIGETIFISFQKRELDASKLNALVGRMRKTPLNVFVEWSDMLDAYAGDKIGDFIWENFMS